MASCPAGVTARARIAGPNFTQEQAPARPRRHHRPAPVPRAFGVAAAERMLHGGAKRVCVDGAARLKVRQEKAAARISAGAVSGEALVDAERNGRGDGRGCSDGGHVSEVQESGNGEPAVALSAPFRAHLFPTDLFLSPPHQRRGRRLAPEP